MEVEAAYYSFPPGWIVRPLKVQRDALHVRILNTTQLLREHLRQKRGGYRIKEEDHLKKMPLSTANCCGELPMLAPDGQVLPVAVKLA